MIIAWRNSADIIQGLVVATDSDNQNIISAPAGVQATAGDTQVTVQWNAVTGATSYNIYWGTSTGVTKLNGTQITGVTSPYVHTGRTNGQTYYYVVTASAEVNATC